MEVPGFLRLGALSPQYSSIPEDALPPVSDRAGLAMFSPVLPMFPSWELTRDSVCRSWRRLRWWSRSAQDRLAVTRRGLLEKDDYYTKDDPAHREASAWAGRGAEALGLASSYT